MMPRGVMSIYRHDAPMQRYIGASCQPFGSVSTVCRVAMMYECNTGKDLCSTLPESNDKSRGTGDILEITIRFII